MKANAVDGWETVERSESYHASAVKPPSPDEWLARAAPSETRASALSADAEPILRIAVERSLRRVGVRLETPAWSEWRGLRFHPWCPKASEHRPTLLAMVLDPVTGARYGIERGFLLPDGNDCLGDNTEKMLLGRRGCGPGRGNLYADALWRAASVDAALWVTTPSRAGPPHRIVAQGASRLIRLFEISAKQRVIAVDFNGSTAWAETIRWMAQGVGVERATCPEPAVR